MNPELVASSTTLKPEVWLPITVTLLVLFWGLRLVSTTLQAPATGPERPVISDAIAEKSDPDGKTSFSRVAGSIGSITLASFVCGLGIWIFFALNDPEPSKLGKLAEVVRYILASSALFAPYAFNQLSNFLRGPGG